MKITDCTFLTTLLTAISVTNTATAADLPFELHTAEYQTYPIYQTFDGAIEAIRRATVSSETSGRISEINFDVDDFVEQGSVLVRITDAATRARLSGVEANVSEAEAQYNVALSEFNRIKEVYARQLVSKSAFDKADADLKAAAQRLSAAQAAVKEVLEQLKYTVVKAPYSGVVAERHVELGEMAKVGQPLFTGFSLNELRAVTNVPQSVVNQIRSATQVSILIAADGHQELLSSFINVYPEADPVTHTYKVRVKLPSVPKGVYPGHAVKIRFTTGEEQRMRIPRQAVVQRSELQAVYVVKDSGVVLRQIRLGRENIDNTVDILAGLEPGDTIALDPVRAGIYLKEPPKQ
ncbi:MAG: efflux RND transporter periplasmic adaptor subunit [Gammaproteobacteria bacterium]|nr:efflux RND transporter periplasmic adaptor subunit [Gammaproteobacteria bacterium]